VSISPLTLMRVLEACDAIEEEKPLVSLVFPKPGGGTGQVFLEWKQGRSLESYVRDPAVRRLLSLYAAMHSRIVDHRNIKRRMSYVLQPGDELRFVRTTPIGGTQ
jgi:hypothetical protein